MIQPWDRNNLGAIEKAILKSDLSLNPNNDGNLIRIQIPDLTEERRKEYVKLAKQKAEECRVSIRNIRRDANDMIKDLEKQKEISEDESKAAVAKVQKITDRFTDEVQKLTDNKEKEISHIWISPFVPSPDAGAVRTCRVIASGNVTGASNSTHTA